MKKYILSSIILLLAAANTAWGQVATVNGTGYTTLADALNAAREAAAGGWNTTSVTVEILEDITFSSTDTWTPIVYNQLNPITINGNNHTITNLPGMLYAKSGSGVSTLTINNLTFESPKAESTDQSSAVIMGYADSVEGLEFNNVHINNATVSGSKWVGAFIGFAAGYSNVNDGPLYQHITFNNCSVTNSTIKNSDNSIGASVGALMGHANGSTDAKIIVNDVTVTGNNISTNETESIKAGALFGTVGALGPVNKSDAGLYVNATVSNNTVKSNGTTITTIYGRQGTSSGRLTLTEGGSYDAAPIAAADMTAGWAALEEGTQLTENSNGTYSVEELPDVAKIGTTGYKTLDAAFAAAQDGETITLLANCTGNGITVPQGKFTTGLTVDFNNYTYTVDRDPLAGSTGTQSQAFQLLKDNKITFKNGTIYSEKARMLVQNYSNLTLENMTLTLNNTEYTSPAYTLSNNNGNVVIDGTTINANNDNSFAFDVCRYASYPSVNVTVTGNSVINGNVEISASGNDAKDGFSLTLEGGTMTGDIVVDASAAAAMAAAPDKTEVTKANTFNQAAPDGYAWKDNGDGTSTLVVAVAKIGDVEYATLAEAVAAATNGQTIEIIADIHELEDGSELEISKAITITGAVDADGKPLYTIYGKNNAVLNNSTWNDIFVVSTGTVTISNLKFAQFSNLTNTAMSRSPILVSSNNNNVVLSNLHFSEINCSAIHINGGSFEISDCYIDCEKTTGTVYTKGIEIVNAAHGTISNTTIVNATGSATTFVAAIEASGSGDVEITGCTINSSSDYAYGIAISTNEGETAGSSAVTVSNCTINAAYTLYNDSDQDGVISVSSGTYTGNLLSDPNENGIVISGGYFSVPVPDQYCALYYEPTEQDATTGLYSVQHVVVAEVYASNGNRIDQYRSFADAWAVANANAGSTLKMLEPDDTASQLEASGTFTLDFNGNQLQYIGTSELASGVILVLRGAHLTLEDTNFDPDYPETVGGIVSDIISYNIDPDDPNPIITADDIHDWYGDVKYAYAAVALTKNGETSTDNAVLTVNGGELYGHYYGITGNGSRHGTVITVNGGTITGAEGSAIYHPQNGTLTITDGTFTGKETGIELRSGTLKVTGGTFETTSTEYSCNPNGSGTTTVGAAIAIAQHTTNQPIDATISGGTFKIPPTGNAVKLSVSNPENNSFTNVAVSGLTDLIGTSNVIPDGYVWSEANGISTLTLAVAKIGDTKYGTLAEAVTAATDGQTIELLANIDLGSSYYQIINKAVTIDGGANQYEIKGTGSDHGTDTEATIVLQGTGNVTLKNLKVTNSSTNNNGVGIKGTTYAGKLTIDNCIITVPMRGVNVEDIADGFSMDITGSTIQSNVTDPTTAYVNNVDSRGISFSDDDELATTVTVTNTKIQGFYYDIYVGENKENLTLTLDGVEAYGKYMLNLSGDNSTINLNSGTTYANGSLVTDEDAYGASTNIIYLDEATKTAQTYNVLDAVTALTTVSAGTGKYKLVSATAAVAQIGDTKYETLEAAFAAVQNGETITMLKDVTLAAPMDVALGTKAVTLDLGGNTLSGRTNLKNGELTIKNGTVAGGNQQALNVYGSATAGATNYSVLNINSDVTVTADQFGVCMFGPTYNSKPGYGAVINIAGTVHTTGNGAEGAVFVSGNLGNNIVGDMNNVINITGSITSDTDAAIALNGNATVNVQDGAAITGNTAIAIKRGTLNVEGGTVHATGLNNIPTPGNNNGTEMTGAAVSMSNTYNQYGGMQVNITGGSFTSDHAMALYKEEDTYQNDATYAVSGGIFNTPVQEEFCAEGYVPTSITTQGFTQYTVAPGDFVAQIGDTKYTTLAAAVAAVPTNGTETTITLLKDITLYNNVVVGGTYGTTPKITTAITNQNVKLDLNGHNITGEKTLYLAGGSLNITGTGSITSNSVDVAPVGVRYVKTDNYPDLDYTSKRTLTIGKNVTLTGAQYGLNIFGTNEPTKANNIDVTVDGTVNGMLFVLGNLSNANNNIVINVSGTVDASHATGSEKVKTGIALCGNASVHIIDGAVVKGESGIEVRAGELIMDGDVGGTITATSADYSYTTNGSGTTVKGAAIAVAQHGTKIATSATILGGTLTGAKKIAVIDAQTNSLAGVTVIADDDFLTNSATETVLPDGYYWLSNGDGTSSPAPNSHVAQIGNTLYATLEAAVAAVQDGETIKLLDDISLTDRLFVNAGATPAYAGTDNRYATTTENKSFTLDLNGHNIVSNSNIALAGGSLNITNTGDADATHGVISSTNAGLAPIEVRGTGDLTQKRTLTVGTGVTLTGAEYGLNVFGSNDAQKNLIDVNVDGTVNGILFVLGNLSNADNAINVVVNGTVDASNAETGTKPKTGIALNGNANVTVNNGASVTGETGIEVRAGNLTVNGGTITATSADYSYTANGSGTTTKGAAIAVAQHTTTKPINVQLNGGTLTGTELIAVTDVNNNDLEGVSVTAKASFVENTDTKLPDGFIWVNNENGTYYIGVAPVQIIHVDNSIDSYATLAEAFNNVEDIETIKLIADVALTEDVTLDKPFNLDFNNHTINLNGHTIKLVQGETIKTNKQTNIFTAADNNYIITVEDSDDPDFPYAYSEKININTANFTVTVTPVTYDGLNHKIGGQNPVTVKIYDVSGEHELNSNNFEITMLPWDSYDAADFNNREEDVYKDAYTYINAITIKGKPEAGYAGSITVDFVIYPRDINDVTVEGQCQPYTETGYTADDNATTGIKKLVTLKYNNIPLVASTTNTIGDYTIDVDATNTYKDTGTYPEAITLTAVEGGNFTGTRKVDFVIGGDKDIAISNITATVVYTGSRQEPTGAGTTPTVIVKDGLTNAVLVQGTDYELEFIEYDESNNYIDYINAKTYTNAVTIRGIGDYYNTKTVDYIITPKNIADCNIIASTTFTGSVINPADAVQVSDPGLPADPPGNQLLAKGTHYTLTVSNGYTYLNPQTYANAITVTGTGNYTGTVTMDFTITNDNGAIDITEAGMVESYVKFTGKNQPPSKGRLIVSVKNPNTGVKETLVYNQDYTFTFNGVPADYYDAKTYSHAVTITGIGNYYGSFTADYVISPRELTERYIVCEAVDPLVWTGTELKLNVNNQISDRTDNNVILKLVNTEADPANNIPEDAYMLSSASDYTYTTEPVTMKDPGEYVVTFTGRYNFTGKRTVTVKVLKNINMLADDDIEIPIQILGSVTPNIRPSNIQDMVVTDGDNVLEQGTHYTLTFTDGTTTYQGGAGPYITQQGKYTAIITGKDPYYSGEKRKDFVVVNEYYTYNAQETGEEFAVHITSGKNLTATVGAKTGAAIATDGTSLTLPSTIDVTVPNASPETFTLNGIENGAFAGCDKLRYIDATAMSGYVPETLTREFDGPFGGLPKQALVYLTGTNIKGENYVYKPGSGDAYYCEVFKIYDDLNGSQTGFDGNDYKWAFENVHKFTAYTVENTRMLTAGKHYTTCLPYSIDIPRNVKAYTLDATSGQIFGFKEVETGTIEAYKPYVLIPSTSGQLLSATDVEVDEFPADATTDATKLNGVNPTNSNFTFYGTMRYMEGADAAGKYIMQYKDNKSTWLSIDESSAGFNESNRACILPMRAYIASTGSGARSYTATFTDIDGIIRTETFTLDDEDTVIYDLSGRRVELLEHGHTYIINGKKVIAK